ncbi:MAG: recombination mediator RecR [Actinobacteria bacterium]|nr:recombination mediator RecR [Actinomycetota bacterium]
MAKLPKAFEKLIEELQKLPGVGPKTAYRLAFFILKMEKEEAQSLSNSIIDLKDNVRYCQICFNLSDEEICQICSDENRNHKQICIVEQPQDAISIERSGEYRGTYHILGGAISPQEGVGPDQLRIRELLERVEKVVPEEVIIATNPNVKGEMTAAYLLRLLKGKVPRITQLATGVPFGGDLDFADEITIAKALQSRRTLDTK